jgi:hypothetical protein
VLRVSARTDNANVYDDLYVKPNNTAGSAYSYTVLYGTGSAAASANGSIQSPGIEQYTINGNTATANTFGSVEVYIPSYTAIQNKVWSAFGVGETNAATAYMGANANLLRNTAAITSLVLLMGNGTNFLAGSSFYLYGI